jgi:hypothetical protein
VILPEDSECLDCDLCNVFSNKRRPECIVYVVVNHYKPQWVIVEAKRSARDANGVDQMQKGLDEMRGNPDKFAVRPRPTALFGVLVHGRQRTRITQLVLNRAKYKLKYGSLIGNVLLRPYGTKIQEYLIPA